MNRILAFIKKYKWPLVSGLIIGTSYIPFPPWGILFGYLPLWFFLIFQSKTYKEAFWAGWTSQFLLTLIGFHWITYTAHEYGQFPWPLAILAYLAFASLAHLHIPLVTLIFFKFKETLKPSLFQSLIFLGFGHGVAESLWPGIFPWNLGYTLLWARLPVFQFADLIGFIGLSFGLLVFQIVLGLIWFLSRKLSTKAFATTMALLVFVGLNIGGNFYAQSWRHFDKKITVLSVQANIGNLEKVYAEKGKFFRDEILNKFINLTELALLKNPAADLILWPETAIPEYLNSKFSHLKNQKRLGEFLTKQNKPLLTGAFSKDESIPDPDKSVFNALFLLDSKGSELSPPYHKTHLLAFGEYLPLSDAFPFLLKLLPFISTFGRGQGPQVLSLPQDIKNNDYALIGGQICYEGLYPEFSIGLAKKGAEILVNVTNDSWFGIPFEPYQHLYMTLARAIEVRRPLIRSTNTGISTAISAYGDIQDLSPWNKEWTGINTVSYLDNPPQTVFTEWGHYAWILIFIAFILNILVCLLNEKSRKS